MKWQQRVFLSQYLSGPFPYIRCHLTINKNVLIALLNKVNKVWMTCWFSMILNIVFFTRQFSKVWMICSFCMILNIYFFLLDSSVAVKRNTVMSNFQDNFPPILLVCQWFSNLGHSIINLLNTMGSGDHHL